MHFILIICFRLLRKARAISEEKYSRVYLIIGRIYKHCAKRQPVIHSSWGIDTKKEEQSTQVLSDCPSWWCKPKRSSLVTSFPSISPFQEGYKSRVLYVPRGENLRYRVYFTFSTIALKAAGLFIARSARTLRLISMPLLWSAPMRRE